jgi:serine/threonine protein kinase
MARTSRQFQIPPADLVDALDALAAGRQSLAEARERLRRTLAADPRQADLLVLWVERARDDGRLPLAVADALLVLAAGCVSEDVPTIGAEAAAGTRSPAPPAEVRAPGRTASPAGPAVAAPAPVRPGAGTPPARAIPPRRSARAGQASPAAETPPAPGAPGPDAVPALRPGLLLKDCYVLGDRLGGGGMAEIYKALDRRRERAGSAGPWVALKIVTVTGEPGTAAAALQREAALAGRLEHPNVVRVFGLDRDGPHLFLAMELLEGESLARRLDQRRQRPLARLHALPLIEGLCRGLAHIHSAGLVHGDIKPGNLFVTVDERVKIIDFGVARDLRSPEPATLPGHTAEYASCEVLAGEPPQPADDIFSAACVAYRLLAGQRPFGNRTALEAEAAGLRPAPIESLAAGQWRALDQALAFRSADRPADVSGFLSAFKGLRDEPDAGPTPAQPPASRPDAEPPRATGKRRPKSSPPSTRWRYLGTWATFVAVCAIGAAVAWWVPGRLPPGSRERVTAPAGPVRETPPPAAGPISPWTPDGESGAAPAPPPPADPPGGEA